MTAQEAIDRAMAENRRAEYLIYGLAVVYVLVGIGIIIWGIARERWVPTVAGFVFSQVLWPAMYVARRTREVNMLFRILAIALDKAETSDKVCEMVLEFLRDMQARKVTTGERPHRRR